MATIRASCPDCGDVELTTSDVRVRVCLDDDRGEYRFTCSICAMVVVKPAEHRTIDLLVASGVEMDTWTLPAELFLNDSCDPKALVWSGNKGCKDENYKGFLQKLDRLSVSA